MSALAACPMKDLHREGLASHTYIDPERALTAVRLLPNEYFATRVDMLLTTMLGSCVAACLRDPVAGVGGMNHFMLPVPGTTEQVGAAESMRYGAYAMDVLIKALEAGGARRERMEAKVFGGGMVLGDMQMGRIGEANAEFVLDYLAQRGIRVLAQDLGDRYPRQLRYYPATGVAQVKRFKRNANDESLAVRERALAATLVRAQAVGEFGAGSYKGGCGDGRR